MIIESKKIRKRKETLLSSSPICFYFISLVNQSINLLTLSLSIINLIFDVSVYAYDGNTYLYVCIQALCLNISLIFTGISAVGFRLGFSGTLFVLTFCLSFFLSLRQSSSYVCGLTCFLFA